MERITVAFFVSATGEKLKPFIIGKAKKPRCFTQFNSKEHCKYYSSSNAWMTTETWNLILSDLNIQMKAANRKIILVADNCPIHKTINLSNVKLLFIPPNTTGYLQPLDLGIIRSFKC